MQKKELINSLTVVKNPAGMAVKLMNGFNTTRVRPGTYFY